MATASIDLPNGTKVKIEGSPEEINKLLELYGGQLSSHVLMAEKAPSAVKGLSKEKNGGGAAGQIRTLIGEGFFGTKRTLSDVQRRLEELGHIYPQTHLSTPLRRLVMTRELRRLRDSKNWVYVNR